MLVHGIRSHGGWYVRSMNRYAASTGKAWPLGRTADAYQKFRGRMPDPAALMQKRGLTESPAADA